MNDTPSIAEKALQINLKKPLYGTLAEIGAGQEVSRWFFKVGGAAGTIAKAMSAYEMTFSDAIYGRESCGRYVVESRVRKMLDHEFNLLETRLTSPTDRQKYFFSFANTVAAKSFKYTGDCHGWMGVRFQRNATEKPSQVILHIRMLDSSNLQQQEALGIVGVNLIYGAFYLFENPNNLLASLLDGDLKNRVEINLVRMEGEAFQETQPHQLNLSLLRQGMTSAVLFTQNQEPALLPEVLYKKQVICHRGGMALPLLTDVDTLHSARDLYCSSKEDGQCDPFLLNEIHYDPKKDTKEAPFTVEQIVDFWQRCRQNILVTRFERAYQLSEYLSLFTNNSIHLVYKAQKLLRIFENLRYNSLAPLARVFNDLTKVYIYPSPSSSVKPEFHKNPESPYFQLNDYQPSSKNRLLFEHLIQSNHLIGIPQYNKEHALWDHSKLKSEWGEFKNWTSQLPPELQNIF